MILLFYNLALLTGLVASAPWWLWRMATTHKYRSGLGPRLGRVPPWLRSTAAAGKPVLWLHAVSVGEVLAVSRLVDELARNFPRFEILVSTTTQTGQSLARDRFGANRVFFCPLDLPWAVRAYLNALKPRMLVLAETEFWPNLLTGCYRRRIPVVVVNARISDRSWPRYRMLRRLWEPILQRLSRVLAQSETDAERLRSIGCPPERVSVSGNLKCDVRAAEATGATDLLRKLGRDLRFVIAGSTLEGEESALLSVWPELSERVAGLVLVLAPRHPERFRAVGDLLDRSGIPWVKRSHWDQPEPRAQIVLLDTIGELAALYALGEIAFVGGSLVAAGGHNPLEPAQFGVPIVMGPHYENFRFIAEDLRAHDALRIATSETLGQTFLDLLTKPEEAAAMGRRARQVFQAQSGATVRTLSALREVLERREVESGTPTATLESS